MSRLLFRTTLVAAGCCLVGSPALAQNRAGGGAEEDQQSLSMYAGVFATDNIGKSSSASTLSRAETELGLAADLRLARERFESALAADLQYRRVKYRGESSQLAGGLHALTRVHLLAEHLSWSVEDDLAQALVNSVDVANPGNTQNTNIFSTGPSLKLPFGSRTSLSLNGRWSNVWYEKSNFGNDRITGYASLSRQTGASSELSLNGQVQNVRYRELSKTEDYDIKSAYFGWLAVGARTTLQLDTGLTRVSEKSGSANGALVSLSVTRRLNSRSELKLNAGRNFGSAADNLRLDQESRGVSASSRPGAISSDPMRSDYASVAWQFDGPRSSAVLRGDWRQELHRTQRDLNRTESRGEFQVSRVLGPRLSLDVVGGYSRNRYSLGDVNFSEWDLGAGVSWRANDAFGVSLRIGHAAGAGDSSDGPGTRDYTENRGEVRLSYTPRL